VFRVGNGVRAVSHSKKSKAWYDSIQKQFTTLWEGDCPVYPDGPLKLTAIFYLQRPKSAKKRMRPHVRPDLSNFLKLVEDALNGLAFKDDAQVCVLQVAKEYATEEQPVGVMVKLDLLGDE
jgi:Holliday junction resolvase RusA-like endonuclease